MCGGRSGCRAGGFSERWIAGGVTRGVHVTGADGAREVLAERRVLGGDFPDGQAEGAGGVDAPPLGVRSGPSRAAAEADGARQRIGDRLQLDAQPLDAPVSASWSA